jgi:ABC-type transporter Mla subunit MlaD
VAEAVAVSLKEIGEERREEMTGEEMERAIEFLLQHQATLEGRIERTQMQLSETQAQLSETQAQIAELGRVVRMQAESQGQLNQTLTTAISALAEAQSKTEAKVDRLAGALEKLVERLSP